MPKIFSKWPIKNVHKIFFLVVTIGISSLYFLEKNPRKYEITFEEREIVSKYAAHFTDLEESVLISDSIQMKISILDDSEHPFIVALYLIESMRGGNSDEMVLSIFEKQSEKLNFVLDKIISSRNYGYYDEFKIKDKTIELSGYKIGAHDALCCPSIPVSLTVKLQNKQLVVLKGQFLRKHET